MENGASDAKDPSGFLSEIIGAPVTVKLNSGVVYKGLRDSMTQSCPFRVRLSLEELKLTRPAQANSSPWTAT